MLLVNICIGEYCDVDYIVQVNLLVVVLVLIDGDFCFGQLFVIFDYFDQIQLMFWLILFELWCWVCVLEFVVLIVCDIYLVNNLCVLCYFDSELKVML